MPTYDYKCSVCERETSVIQSISSYVREPIRPMCIHGGETCVMERKLSVNPAMSGLANALAGDRHYDDMRASDGTDISSRSKHREYMKRHNLTTMDDFTNTWKAAEQERVKSMTGQDPERRQIVKELVERAVAQPD